MGKNGNALTRLAVDHQREGGWAGPDVAGGFSFLSSQLREGEIYFSAGGRDGACGESNVFSGNVWAGYGECWR
ncbi:hypothetical protein MRB53_030700 [Persea americana]|uniref:Uncharacterized protein n=1 Tax=Persea americana TaxID=3435 RepID=A0ACC2KM20_PERAE|nr:hypothetical protein MRB53_030700 [Persea americana]